jgi:hypothetical protein
MAAASKKLTATRTPTMMAMYVWFSLVGGLVSVNRKQKKIKLCEI